MATNATPWCRQNEASSAMPAAVLLKQAAAPSWPILASRKREQTSTPQMILVTVTYLVRAIDVGRLFGRACQQRRSLSSLTVMAGGITGAVRYARGSNLSNSSQPHFPSLSVVTSTDTRAPLFPERHLRSPKHHVEFVFPPISAIS